MVDWPKCKVCGSMHRLSDEHVFVGVPAKASTGVFSGGGGISRQYGVSPPDRLSLMPGGVDRPVITEVGLKIVEKIVREKIGFDASQERVDAAVGYILGTPAKPTRENVVVLADKRKRSPKMTQAEKEIAEAKKKLGRPRVVGEPWNEAGVSERTWYRWSPEKRAEELEKKRKAELEGK